MIINLNDDQGIELLHWIFERELKPPFREGKKDYRDRYPSYNRDGECIGWLDPYSGFMVLNPFWTNIQYKVCQVFEFPRNTTDWWEAIKPHLKSWLENQINVKVKYVVFKYLF